MRALCGLAVLLALGGCADNREQDTDACTVEAMRAHIQPATAYVRACMSGKGYAYRMDDLCIGSYGRDIVLWSCFQRRPLIKLGS